MFKKKNTPLKSQAQAMVEFAIALPVLLMLLYGILEAGRMLFLYSSVVTASRQAVRYGTATGSGGDFTSDGGPNNTTYNRYQDCYGIRAAANRAGFLGQFDSIAMEFDTGPSTTVTTHCTAGANFDTDLSPINNNYRLIVTVSEQFTPLVPRLVPFLNRTFSATSARTILYRVDIVVTAPAGSGGAGTGDLSLAITTNPTSVSTLQNVSISYVVTNTGSVDLTTPITLTTDKGTWSCAGQPATLTANGGSFTCTGSYTVSQPELDAGINIVVTASAAVGASSSGNATATITVTQTAALTLDKTGPVSVAAQNNTPVSYTYTLTNTGNITLGSPYSVTDDKVANNDLTCPSSGTIAPGAFIICTGTYTIKNSDISAGFVTNTATATATRTIGSATVTSNSDSWTVVTPAVFLSVSASSPSATTVGQPISYNYILTNNISSTIKAPYTVSDSRVTNELCTGTPTPLNPGGTTPCSGSYIVTQADLDAGVPLTSTITATALKATNPGANSVLTSNTVNFSIPVVQNPSLTLAVTAAPNPATVLNTVVTYTYTLTNNGNVTLSSPSITDDKATTTCADTSPIAPGGTRVCTGTRTISQTDLDDGSVISNATATTTLGAGTVSSNTVSTTVTTFVGARLTLVITANPNPATGSGQLITFTYTLRNTGNVVLSSPYSVTSTLAGAADCLAASATIPVAGSTTCVGFYTTQPGDVGTSITDSATATAMDGATTVTSNNATLNVPVNP